MESGEMDLLSKKAILSLPRDVEKSLDGKILDEYINVKDIEALPTIQPVATDTNVGDKISRQQAIELIKNYCENGCDIAEDNWCPSCQREQFMKLLKALPTVPPEPQWIPVSERLPEKGGEYLVSVHHTIGAISVFHPEKDTYVDDVAIMKYYGKFPSTVRAWMPLPEAYKEGGEKI